MSIFTPQDISDMIAGLGQPVTIAGQSVMAVVDSHSLDALHAQALGVDTVLLVASDLVASLPIIGGANGTPAVIGVNSYLVRKVSDEGNGFASLELEKI